MKKDLNYLLTYLPTNLLTLKGNPSIPLPRRGKKTAFTLAETLITLGIIGVVAALTLPSFIAKYQEKQTAVALKKFYTSLSQAYVYAKNEYGTPDNWYDGNVSEGNTAASNRMVDILTKYMRTSKVCYSGKGCFPDLVYNKIDGGTTENWNRHSSGTSKFITSDGMSVFIYSYGSRSQNTGGGVLEETYGALSVDVNGFKNPNCAGKDMFSFLIAKDGVLPAGSSDALIRRTSIKAFPRACNTNDCYNFCEGCAAWVIYNENMDYLHCDGLSWDGAHSCKEVE